MNVPFVDLKTQYQIIKSEIDAVLEDTFNQSVFVGGSAISAFERAFADYVQTNHCVACGNGTDALEIALRALGIGEGDEVIVPAMSWISTSEVVTTVGASPIFADVLPDLFTINPQEVESKITSRTKAIIPVHLYGRAAEVNQLKAIADKHKLKILEDGAQAHGAEFNKQRVGTFGDLAAFSFYPSKNLGAYGDAGGIVTDDETLAKKCRIIANHGQDGKHNHLQEGRNSRMDTLQAAVLNVKLKYLDQWTDARLRIAKHYNDQLEGLPIITPKIDEQHRHAFHLYVIQVDNRDKIQQKLTERGIATQIHNPKALPELKPYQDRFDMADFPIARKLATKGLSLPMYPELSQKQQDYVVQSLKEILQR